MDTITKLAIGVAAIVGLLFVNISIINNEPKAINQLPVIKNESPIQQIKWSEIGEYKYTPTIQQKAWIWSLFWCESRGNPVAINPEDLDHSPSYGIAQFKPQTLKYYSVRYRLLQDNLEIADYTNWAFDADLAYEVVVRMVGERNNINWKKEFPNCVKRLGFPPK